MTRLDASGCRVGLYPGHGLRCDFPPFFSRHSSSDLQTCVDYRAHRMGPVVFTGPAACRKPWKSNRALGGGKPRSHGALNADRKPIEALRFIAKGLSRRYWQFIIARTCIPRATQIPTYVLAYIIRALRYYTRCLCVSCSGYKGQERTLAEYEKRRKPEMFAFGSMLDARRFLQRVCRSRLRMEDWGFNLRVVSLQ